LIALWCCLVSLLVATFLFYATTLHDDLPNSIMLVWYSDRFLIPIFALARSISNLDVCYAASSSSCCYCLQRDLVSWIEDINGWWTVGSKACVWKYLVVGLRAKFCLILLAGARSSNGLMNHGGLNSGIYFVKLFGFEA
jgi:hypothetical protein